MTNDDVKRARRLARRARRGDLSSEEASELRSFYELARSEVR